MVSDGVDTSERFLRSPHVWFSHLSLWPAAVRITLAQLVEIRSDVDILCLDFTF